MELVIVASVLALLALGSGGYLVFRSRKAAAVAETEDDEVYLWFKQLAYEVLGTGRSGDYPDMGLRDWAREWRKKLRETDSYLDQRLSRLETLLSKQIQAAERKRHAAEDQADGRRGRTSR